MNETIQTGLAPLAAFWIGLDGMTKMARFVNELRETIILGEKDKIRLTQNHRQAMFVDWLLSVIGFVFSSFVFGVVVYSIAEFSPKAAFGLYGVAVFVWCGGIGFAVCGVSDYRAIKYAIANAE